MKMRPSRSSQSSISQVDGTKKRMTLLSPSSRRVKHFNFSKESDPSFGLASTRSNNEHGKNTFVNCQDHGENCYVSMEKGSAPRSCAPSHPIMTKNKAMSLNISKDDPPRLMSPLLSVDTTNSFIRRHYFGAMDHNSNSAQTGSHSSSPKSEERDTLDSVRSRRFSNNDCDHSHRDVFTANQQPTQRSIESHKTALAAIKRRDWSSLIGIIHDCPEIITMNCDSELMAGLHGCRGGSLLHVLLSQRPLVMKHPKLELVPAVPEAVLQMIINRGKKVLTMADQDGRLPLHIAILANAHAWTFIKRYEVEHSPNAVPISEEKFTAQHGQVIRSIISGHEEGTAVPDKNGCLPLHYALAQPRDKNPLAGENINERSLAAVSIWTVKLLLKTNPDSVGYENYHGQQPIHVVCSRGESANLWNLRSVLSCHKARRISLCCIDNNGDSPLHLAIKSRVPHKIVECMVKSDPSLKMTQLLVHRDSQNNIPLHTALILPDPLPCTETTLAIMDAAPFSLTVPDNSSRIPILRAIERDFPAIIIRRFLEADMPIELGNCSDSRNVVSRVHSFSWWYVVVGGGDKYLQMIHEFLSSSATQPQIISLLKHVGPDGTSSVQEAVSEKSLQMFSSLLWCLDRYQLIFNSEDTCQRKNTTDYTVFHAWDYGPQCNAREKRREWFESFSSGSITDWTPFSVKVDEAEHIDGENENGIEVFLSEQLQEKRKVILHCYDHEEAFLAEIKVRNLHDLSSFHTESINNTHYKVNCREMFLDEHELIHCIAFEVPDHTLARVFQLTSAGSRSPKWISKCRIVLKQIASALRYLHEQGLVHGDVDPSNIAKYGNCWKLTKVGTVTPIGFPMRGVLRPSVPPESISGTPDLSYQGSRSAQSPCASVISSTSVSVASSRVTFAEEDLLLEGDMDYPPEGGSSKVKEYKLARSSSRGSFTTPRWDDQSGTNSLHLDDDVPLRFAPEQCSASPSWDVWSFGLVMVQLLVGRTTVLPNFEKAKDAHMRNLSSYSKSNLKKIYQQVQAIAGREAADLVGRILRPNPERRPTMQRVLQHSYFDENSELKSLRSPKIEEETYSQRSYATG